MGEFQHHLPAAVIGVFGSDQVGSRRKRYIFTESRQLGTSKEQAKKLARARGIYDSEKSWTPRLEKFWRYFEPELPGLIERISYSRDNLHHAMLRHEIAGQLLPYLASTAVRGPDYDSAHAEWTADLPEDSPIQVDVNYSRQYAFRKMAGRLLRSTWRFDYAPPGSRFILNDLGYAVCPTSDLQRFAILFPLSPNLAVWVDRSEEEAHIRAHQVTSLQVAKANRMVAAQAWDSIYGRKLGDILGLLSKQRSSGFHPELDLPRPEIALQRSDEVDLQIQWQNYLDLHGLPFPEGVDRVLYHETGTSLGRIMLALHEPHVQRRLPR